ncbi:MAG: membrane dipeptidase [Pyrinomonadaceae bacterium]|nr:membrane dipeptidase [Phycisphaerales bacterium]
MPLTWFDSHLDLGYLAVCGRDMTAPLDIASIPHPPAAVTLPSLAEGHVRFALGTIFTEPMEPGSKLSDPQMYTAGDAERAFVVGRAQLEAYRTWQDRGLVALDLCQWLRRDDGVGAIRGGMGVAEVVAPSIRQVVERMPPVPALRLGILIENADPIRSPDDISWWKDRGVVAVGMAWARSSRYAGGNSTQEDLSDSGRALARAMDAAGVVHDVSHLSDNAMKSLLQLTDRPVIASHSNCRSLLGGGGFGENQRHLPDDTIREIGRRGGVVGLNLFSKFLNPPASGVGGPGPRVTGNDDVKPRATIDDCINHVEHVCTLMGHRRGVGLGSDMDGGFSSGELPQGIQQPRDLALLAEGLRRRDWTDDEIRGFAYQNWASFFQRAAERL